MSTEIYYMAERETPMSKEEKAKMDEIIHKYWEEYPHKDDFEGPGFFNNPDSAVIFEGVMRIPCSNVEELDEFFDYWLKWLSELTWLLPDAKWDAGVEDVPFIWEEDNGWRLMTDEEYYSRGQ